MTPGIETDFKECCLFEGCERRGWKLVVHRFDPDRVDVFADEIHADGFVIVPEMITFQSPLLSRLITLKVAKVVLGRDTSNMQLDFVTGDDPMTLTEVIKGLTLRGHQRIAYLVCEPHFHEVEENIRVFTQLSHALGLEYHAVLDVDLQYGENGFSRSAEFLANYLAELPGGRLPFTALVTCSASGSIPALRVFHDAGFRVPDDCSLFCMGRDQNAKYAIPSLSNTMAHHEERTESCLRILEQRFAGDSVPLLFERGINQPIWRESVAPPPRKHRSLSQGRPPLAVGKFTL
jgi:DNA-binding LacI/PurR family transcriptional regulator